MLELVHDFCKVEELLALSVILVQSLRPPLCSYGMLLWLQRINGDYRIKGGRESARLSSISVLPNS